MTDPGPDSVDTASAEQIADHLATCDPRFVVGLAERVDLGEYIAKIVDRATRVEAWRDGLLVGLVAVYVNDIATRVAYVTHVSVSTSHEGEGIARRLVSETIALAAERGMERLDLEVATGNDRARRLYERLGLHPVGEDGGTTIMSRSLEAGA